MCLIFGYFEVHKDLQTTAKQYLKQIETKCSITNYVAISQYFPHFL